MLGVGIDLVEVERVDRLVRRHPQALTRLFTPGERAWAASSASLGVQRLAARFAAKEAVYKALGATGPLPWRDIEVLPPPTPQGEWVARLTGRALVLARHRGVERVWVSMSHTRTHAVAQAVAVGPCAC